MRKDDGANAGRRDDGSSYFTSAYEFLINDGGFLPMVAQRVLDRETRLVLCIAAFTTQTACTRPHSKTCIGSNN